MKKKCTNENESAVYREMKRKCTSEKRINGIFRDEEKVHNMVSIAEEDSYILIGVPRDWKARAGHGQ
jgi:hypothetical protein